MARDFKVKARIEVEDKASAKVGKVRTSFDSLREAIGQRLVFTAGDLANAFRSLVGVFTGAVAAAQKQEDAVRRLESALSRLGPSAAGVSESLQQQAAALERVTRFGDEAIISQQALLATMGVSADQMQLATQATVDLAAAFGISLESAARNIGKTVGGFAGELGELIPELKELDQEALRAGDGIALLAEKFSGRAVQDAKTFSGVVDQIRNALGTLNEKLGESVTQSSATTAAMSELRDTLTDSRTVQSVTALAQAFTLLATGILKAFNALNLYIDKFAQVATFIPRTVLGFTELTDNTEALEAQAKRYGITVDELKDRLAAQSAEMRKLNAATQDSAESAEGAAGSHRELAAALGEQADAAENAVQATRTLGQVTSAQLATQISQIVLELELQKEVLGANSDEYVRLERTASLSIASLEERIASLRAGHGDLTDEVEGTAAAYEAYGASVNRAGQHSTTLAGALRTMRGDLANIRSELITTTAQFDRLAASAGNASAVSAGLRGGGSLTLGGTRINLPGGGSRLVSQPNSGRFTPFNISGGTFTTIRRAPTVGINGRVQA